MGNLCSLLLSVCVCKCMSRSKYKIAGWFVSYSYNVYSLACIAFTTGETARWISLSGIVQVMISAACD